MNKGVIIGLFVVAIAAILGATLFLGGSKGGEGEDPSKPEGKPEGKAPTAQVAISMLYSTEKEDWIKSAAAEFTTAHPEIKLDLKGMGSFKAAEAILDGTEKPTVFSPSDTLAMNLLAADWDAKHHTAPFLGTPEPLVITPLVFVIWEERAQVLQQSGGVNWKTIHKAVSSNQGWPAIGGKADWGFVKLGHTDPTLSNSGLQTVFLMSLDFYQKNSITVSDILDPKYQEWVGQLEKGVGKFEASSGTFMTDMVRFGPSKYDIAVVYESLAISQLGNAQGRWGNLKVYYPSTTVWSDNPAVILQGATPDQQAAAKEWLSWLHGSAVQQRALSYGFRPADPAIPIKTADANNPFVKYAPYGVQVEIPPVATMPEGSVVRNMMTMWSRVVGR